MTEEPRPEVPQRARDTALARRRRLAVAVAVGAAVIAAGGMAASGWVQSPAQAAADTSPPAPSAVTAPVERKVLRSTTVVRGTFSSGRAVAARPVSVAATATSDPTGTLLVTGVFTRPGRPAPAGRALLEYSGRPVFALPGAIPAYRDLSPGDRGKDVDQLQRALRSLGHGTGADAAGRFGSGTAGALGKLYRAMGYEPPLAAPGAKAQAEDTGTGTAPSLDTAATGPARPPTSTGTGRGGGATSDPSLALAPTAAPAVRDAVAQPMLPASEVVYVPGLPARVVSVPVRVGDSVDGPVITLARSGMTLVGRLDPAQAGLVTEGLAVTVLSETTGAEQRGTVDSVGKPVTPAPGGKPGAGTGAEGSGTGDTAPDKDPTALTPHVPLTIKPTRPWDDALAGQDVRITITSAATDGPVLAVPLAAVSAGADTRTTVTVLTGRTEQRTVEVKAGVSADGMVAVTPVNGGLRAGDQVVVGR
ncbi:hypothetical protein [Streptomyces clavuligerus]|nr:hypothetical protein [Streptomyces clavuligerus]WDN52917.1 peptidoglycan-binding protein [Streptomyces clavuligerus]